MIEKLPNFYSDECPPHMKERIMWQKINDIIEFINPYKVACERHGNSTVKDKDGRCPLCESIKVKGLYDN